MMKKFLVTVFYLLVGVNDAMSCVTTPVPPTPTPEILTETPDTTPLLSTPTPDRLTNAPNTTRLTPTPTPELRTNTSDTTPDISHMPCTHTPELHTGTPDATPLSHTPTSELLTTTTPEESTTAPIPDYTPESTSADIFTVTEPVTTPANCNKRNVDFLDCKKPLGLPICKDFEECMRVLKNRDKCDKCFEHSNYCDGSGIECDRYCKDKFGKLGIMYGICGGPSPPKCECYVTSPKKCSCFNYVE